MPVYLTRLTESAHVPTRATEYAAGLDVYAAETATIHEYNRAWVSTGIAVALDPWHVGQIWPRSGLPGMAWIPRQESLMPITGAR